MSPLKLWKTLTVLSLKFSLYEDGMNELSITEKGAKESLLIICSLILNVSNIQNNNYKLRDINKYP